mmetsp:Transcript_171035/g.415705  ORF Transcript_171035/g.415705 Transcript_171035/m.415705 type:complete len:240 (+) Transcript_171035:68-787(+)
MVTAAVGSAKVALQTKGLPSPLVEIGCVIVPWMDHRAGRQGGDAVELRLSEELVAKKDRRKRQLHVIPAPMTTLMIRNVPLAYTVQDLLSLWPPKDNYDYLYLPQDSNRIRTTSYAFLNFKTHQKAMDFNEQWHGRFMPHHKAPKSLSITVAGTQGLRENLSRLSSMDLDCMAANGTLPITLCANQYVDARLLFLALGLKVSEEADRAEGAPHGGADTDFTKQPSVEDVPLPNFLCGVH